jgi:hypothetical protein
MLDQPFSMFWFLALASLAACDAEPPTTGRVDMALVGQAPSGTVYRLRDAIITVEGAASTHFFDTEDDPNRTSLALDVVPGDYSVFLQEGWRLERIAAGGTATTVEATYLSPNPQHVTVFSFLTTHVELRFRAGTDIVVMDPGTIEIEVVVEESTTPIAYCDADSDCAAGQTCCLAGFLGTCRLLGAGESCPLPDLTVSDAAAISSLRISTENFAAASCALVEGCVDAPGERRLLRFSTQTPNLGTADMVLGDPTEVPGFEFSACHGHYHFEGYAAYELTDASGTVVATGHKQAFCLLDSNRVLSTASTTPRFSCSFQGIQAGWADTYGSGLDCQWVDITDVPAGDYQLRIEINPEHTLPESDYSNNAVSIPVTIPGPPTPGDVLAACSGFVVGTTRDCGWQMIPGWQGVACTPGETVTAGCGGCTGSGSCTDDAILRVCPGGTACTNAAALASGDDGCATRCPTAMFVCPPSGQYTLLTGAFSAGEAASCTP